jgi:hypothetical protein
MAWVRSQQKLFGTLSARCPILVCLLVHKVYMKTCNRDGGLRAPL